MLNVPTQVRGIFEGIAKVTNVRSDVGDTWFVTMESEDAALSWLLQLKSKGQTFNSKPIKVCIKMQSSRHSLPASTVLF